MVTKRKTATSKGRSRKLKVRKETIKDLDARQSGKNVKGEWGRITVGCPTADCPKGPTACTVCGILIG
jgi:hypothetical protein